MHDVHLNGVVRVCTRVDGDPCVVLGGRMQRLEAGPYLWLRSGLVWHARGGR